MSICATRWKSELKKSFASSLFRCTSICLGITTKAFKKPGIDTSECVVDVNTLSAIYLYCDLVKPQMMDTLWPLLDVGRIKEKFPVSGITKAQKKARQVCSNVKVMLTCFFDSCGIVHHEYTSEGQTINKEYYLEVLHCLHDVV